MQVSIYLLEILMALATLSVPSMRALGDAWVPLDAFTTPGCESFCWQGIEVEATKFEQAKVILEKRGIDYTASSVIVVEDGDQYIEIGQSPRKGWVIMFEIHTGVCPLSVFLHHGEPNVVEQVATTSYLYYEEGYLIVMPVHSAAPPEFELHLLAPGFMAERIKSLRNSPSVMSWQERSPFIRRRCVASLLKSIRDSGST